VTRVAAGARPALAVRTAGAWLVRGLLADAAVDSLAEQVRVAEVAGVLLDHVEYHLAQRDGSAVLHGAPDGEIGRAGDELLREGDLLAPGQPGVGHHRRVCDRARLTIATASDRAGISRTEQGARIADLAQTVAVGGRGSYGVQIVMICWVTSAGRSRLPKK